METAVPMMPIVQAYKEQVISKFSPNFKLEWKSKSKLMKALKVLLFFNQRFMEYFTTFFETVYVPDDWNTFSPTSALSIIAHEAVHIYDSKKNPLMGFLYVTPQILFPIIAIGLAFVSPWFLLLALLVALPLPSFFRFYYELRGYRMNLLLLEKYSGWAKDSEIYLATRTHIIEQMVGPAYFFMMPFKSYVEKKLDETGWENEEIYQETLKFAQNYSFSE